MSTYTKQAYSLLILKTLTLTHFKNHSQQTLSFSESLNCFVGNNGMGKTNLLDAIYYLCMTKSHFGLSDQYIAAYEATFFRLDGTFARQGKNERIVIKVVPGKRKEVERNAVAYGKLSEHIGFLPVVMVAPDDTAIAKEGSEIRRRFLDNTLSQQDPDYLSKLLSYNKILKQRNAALKQFAENDSFDYALLNAYNTQLIHPAAVIHEKRKRFIELFVPIFERYYDLISGRREQVSCVYKSPLSEANFLHILEKNIEKDRYLQRTTSGVHRDDLLFLINDLPLKRHASQGQLKSYIFALKLAQYAFLKKQKGMNPILLLDDLFDKLDTHRVTHLLQLLLDENFGQVFITDTEAHRLAEIIRKMDIAFRLFRVEDGTVRLLKG